MKKNKVIVIGSVLVCLSLNNFSYGMQKKFRSNYLPTKSSTVTKIDFSRVKIDYTNQNEWEYKKLSQTLKSKGSLNDINVFLRHNPTINLVIANQLLYKLSFISFETCQSFFQIIKYPDKYTYNTFIKAASKYGKFAAAQQTFNEAKQKKQVDAVTYATFIDAAGKNGEFKQALLAFNDAKRDNLANVVTYNSFINTAGKNGKFEQALLAFNDAKRDNLANAVTYATFIDAAGKNGEFKQAQQAFKKAKQKKQVDAVTYNSFINVLMNSNLPENKKTQEAETLAQQYLYPNIDK
ncbi:MULTISPECIES: hypothetical protein [Francisella]|uniref:Tetratricopeptide repeat protein n=1 Tax=Francisella opportunistica TaxID=2016517 RepID=A0A345JS85_9GAMM|nr:MULTISPECIES: hypothetical protein [Francisella]AXH30181.1 hypothetical protein CGC43_06095 [Francisella opportunistica]AXH31822.1 hypothetical protein CGC44_06075 [Francisella opportunistica]AXH33468.1 hypothetical protein CGC45_06085 [Francisella opportunistica]